MKVLIVDCNKERRRDMVATLGDLTNVAIVGAVASVRSALHALGEAPPDVVVSAATLPDGDSTFLAERVRRLSQAPRLVVVTESRDHQARYLAAGVDRCVTHDEELRGLSEVVCGMASRRRPAAIPTDDVHRLLGRITAGVVHDVNNYLGAAELTLGVVRQVPHDAKLWEQLHAALDAAARLNRMLLDYARGIAPARALVDVGATVRKVLGVATRLEPDNVTVRAEIAEDLPALQAVAVELEQLVLNLVVNAFDAMPSGGELSVSVRTATQPTAIVLRIADTGVGMSSYTPGVGLGLGIVHAVAERHRGTVRFTTGDHGTVVTVVLPA